MVKRIKEKAGAKPIRYSFSRYLLNRYKIELYQGDKRILSPDEPKFPNIFPEYFNIKPLEPTLITGTLDKKPEITSMDMREFKNKGLALVSGPIKGKPRFHRQRHEYNILWEDDVGDEEVLVCCPKLHGFEYDILNKCVKLVKKKKRERAESRTDWFYLEGKPSKREKGLSLRDEFGLSFEDEEVSQKLKIKKGVIPIGICWEEHKLVCIPELRDVQHMGLIGATGSGKTLLAHYLIDMFYWWLGYKLFIMYDYKGGECYYWNTPNDVGEWISKLYNQINLEPRPLPCVLLTPYSSKMPKRMVGSNESIHYNISMSWKYFINNWNELTRGYDELKLEKAKMQVDWKIIGACKKEQAVHDYLDTVPRLQQEHGGGTSMKAALKSRFNHLFNSQLFDISNKIDSQLTIKYPDGVEEQMDTIIALMKRNLIPVLLPKHLETSQFGDSSILPSYLNAILKNIYDLKNSEQIFVDEKMYIFFDEVGQALSKKISEPLIQIASLGRSDGIGLIWANQIYSNDIPDQVKDNTSYLFILSSPGKAKNEIFKLYNHSGIDERIHTIGEKDSFECYILHNKPLITYDLDTGEEEVNKFEPMRVSFFPPLSAHHTMGEEKKEDKI